MKHYAGTLVSVLIAMPLLAAPPVPDGHNARIAPADYIEFNWSRTSDRNGYTASYELNGNGSATRTGDAGRYTNINVEPGVRYTSQVVAMSKDNERTTGDSTVSISLSATAPRAPARSGSTSTNVPPSIYCIDEDDDGRRRDGGASCVVSDSAAIDCAVDQGCVTADTLETPFITDRSQTTSVVVCVDTDANDRGWTGTDSCRIELDTKPQIIECIDTDGDGWGWTGTDTCYTRDTFI